MKIHKDITMTLTIGGRPKELERSLASIDCQVKFAKTIAANDFIDDVSSAVFKHFYPEGDLIVPEKHQGHHAMMDALYKNIETPYVFHTEDDWQFEESLDFQRAKKILDSDPKIVSVCFSKISNFTLTEKEKRKIRYIENGDLSYVRLDSLHAKWHGYTFNPHLIKLSTIKSIGAFSAYRKERHISHKLRKQGYFVAFIQPGCCHHIGEVSVANPDSRTTKGKLLRFLRKYFGFAFR